MKRLRVFIVDDEKTSREVLKFKLAKMESIEILGEAQSAEEAYNKLEQLEVDVIFLDISMPKESGFDFLDRYKEIPFEIIFATGYEEYVLDALRVSAVDYVLKPFSTEKLVDALDRTRKKIDSNSYIKKYDVLKDNLNTIGDQESVITIFDKDSYHFIKMKNIIRCEGWKKYTQVFLSDGQKLLSSHNLGHFSKSLESYSFYSCHKSHLINIKHIKKYKKDGILEMSDSSQVPVSRRKKAEFMKAVLMGE